MDAEKDSQDTSLKCIEEYYRKYSRDGNLHKYFSGTSVSYLPPLRIDDESTEPMSHRSPGPSTAVEPTSIDKDADKCENVSILSGKSEVSEKKLEWDSGADIGYQNYNRFEKPMSSTSFRSLSLPTLKDLRETKITFPVSKPKTQLTTSSSDTSSSVKKTDVLVVSCSSSPVPTSSKPSPYSSTSSEIVDKDKYSTAPYTSSEEANSKSTEQGSLRSKVAHLSETLNVLKLAIGLPDAYSTPKLPETAKLPPSKLSSQMDKKKVSHKPKSPCKVINLTLSTPVTIQCVEPHRQVELLKNNFNKNSNKDVVFGSNPTSKDIKPIAYNKTSDSDLNASNCESFEYFDGNSGSLPLQSASNVKNNDSVTDDTMVQDNIDKAVTVVQRFFDSRQMSYTKKRKYIKKMIHRIESKFQTRFLDDSSSNHTTSPDIFVSAKGRRNVVSMGNLNQNVKSAKQSDDLKPPTFAETDKINLEKNVSKYDNIFNKIPTQIYVSHNFENPTSFPKQFNSEKSPTSDFSGKEKNFAKFSSKTPSNSEKKTNPVSSISSNPGQSDLVTFVKNERAYQISWINNEIQHLTKLKQLLENPPCNTIKKPNTPENSDSSKSSFEDGKTSKTSYRVKSTSGDSEQEKDYVIKTQRRFDPSQRTIFQLDGKRYTVEDTSSPKRIVPKESKHVIISDIEVETKESVTNIKINSFCEQCNDSVCHCKDDHSPLDSGSLSDQAQIAECGSDVPECYDSLKKIFDSCHCMKGEKCRCIFVKNILKYFGGRPSKPPQSQNKTDGISCECQTKNQKEDISTETDHQKKSCVCSSTQVENTNSNRQVEMNTETFNENTSTQTRKVDMGSCNKTDIITQTVNQTEHISTQVRIKLSNADAQVHTDPCFCSANFSQTETEVKEPVTTENQTETHKSQVGSQTAKLTTDSDCSCDKVTTTEPQVADTEVGNDVPTFKSQTSFTTDLNPRLSYATQSTQTQVNVESVGVGDGCSALLNSETQTSLEFIGKIPSGPPVRFPIRKRALDQPDTSPEDLPDGSMIQDAKPKIEDKEPEELGYQRRPLGHHRPVQAVEAKEEKPVQFSPNMTSKQTQTRFDRGPERFKTPVGLSDDRTNSSNSTKPSNSNSTDVSECKKSEYPYSVTSVCICCKSASDLGSLFCNACRRKYDIKKRCNPDNAPRGYCSCTKKRYCRYCQCKLSKTSRSQGGIAYTLTLESFSSEVEPEPAVAHKSDLEEIKLKVPKKIKKKSSKEKENYIRRMERDGVEGKSGNDAKASYTLQEHLASNKPDFVNMADYRRAVITNSKLTREQKGDMARFNFLESKIGDQIPRQLFSDKEMKAITRKHYCNKIKRDKEMSEKKAKLKKADRLIADIFSKKLQQQILAGKRNLPTDKILVKF